RTIRHPPYAHLNLSSKTKRPAQSASRASVGVSANPHSVRAAFISRANFSASCQSDARSIQFSHALMASGDKTTAKNSEARSKSHIKGPRIPVSPVLRQAGAGSLASRFKSTDAGALFTSGLLHDNNQLTRI